MRQGYLSTEDQTATTADTVHMPTHQIGRALRVVCTALGQLFRAHQRAYAKTDATDMGSDRLTRQHRGAERFGQHGKTIEDGRIARRYVNRQHRRLAAHGHARETFRPTAITHTSR